jgi:hypothetical protein
MKNRYLKFAAAVAPAALLLASGATPADAKVLLLGDGGWEVSFDGSVNGFATWNSSDNVPGAPALGQTRLSSVGTAPGQPDGTVNDTFRVRTGLLPAVWGMNVKAPTTGGLDMAARIGLYPNISNDLKNSFAPADLDLREIFFTVDGSWGQVLVGKTLSQFLGKNILTDMTLFGVGGIGATSQGGGTTLGRIGYGYVYPQFNARIQYTTPDMSGFKFGVGIYDPSRIVGTANAGTTATGGLGAGLTANETDMPRFEGEASWAGSLFGANVLSWISGMYQSATFSGNSTGAACPTAANTVSTVTVELNCLNGSDATTWGFGGGAQVGIPVGPGTLELTGSGYVGEALGTTLQIDTDSLDFTGNERSNWGYIGQVGYAFGQGTKLQASYGESNQDETGADKACRTSAGTNSGTIYVCPGAAGYVIVETQSLWDIMLTHDVNPNLKLVAEYGRQTSDWADGADQDTDIFSLGAFFFW